MASILIVDDEDAVAEAYGAYCARLGHDVIRAQCGSDAIDLYRSHRPDVVFLDLRLPDMSGFDVYEAIRADDPVVIMISGHGDIPHAVRAVQSGVENFLTKPVELAHLSVALDRALEKVQLRRLGRYLTERRTSTGSIALGTSGRMQELSAQIELLAASDKTTVLILGESGTGKGRVASLLHAHSRRAERPFVEANCAALGMDALDEELFGVDGSANTPGGPVRAGLLEVADGGTLFLDEIGELPAPLQLKLLRVLEGRPFRRCGGTRDVQVNVRLVAATNKDLVNEVTEQRFREDLYYRLSVMPVYLPPLRARSREDLAELIARLIDELSAQLPEAPRQLSDDVLDRLSKHAWPGNIRELRNVLERAMIVGRGTERIELSHLPVELRHPGAAAADAYEPRTLEDLERTHIERTLRAHGGNRTHAARALGISRATLIKKIRDFGLARLTPSARRNGER
ncbi:MAG: sigma-54 dependent transcriptional regulator [Gemmatimonadaceae bacterium]